MEAVKNKIESLKRAVGEKEDHISDLEHQLKEEKSHNQKVAESIKWIFSNLLTHKSISE